MKFQYEGFNNVGQAKKGEIEAPDEGKAAELLRDEGIFAQKLVGEGETLKTVLPGNDTTKPDKMVMPWQDPEPPKLEDDEEFKKARERQKRIDERLFKKPAETKTLIMPEREWKANLKHNLDAIDEVVAQFKKLRPKADKRTTAAKDAAVDELVGQAIKRAVAEAL